MKMRRRRGQKVLIPVASMGDIAFLLIIFFMICGEFVTDRSPPVPLPQDEFVAELDDPATIFVAVDAEGRIYLQSELVTDASMLEQGIAALLEGREEPEERVVILKCHREVTADVYEPVFKAIAGAGGRIAALGDRP